MEKVRYGIIGLGNMGKGHCKNFFRGSIENGIVAGICDIKPARIEAVKALAEEFQYPHEIASFTDYKEMLASGRVDAVIVAVPHYFHPPISIDAMKAGIHVICEKPAGVYTKQVKQMNAVAAESDCLFTMMFNQRTNCLYRKMREMVQSGELGEIRRVNWIITDWYRSQSYYDSGDWRATWRGEGGGVIFNQCPHQIDLLQWVLGMTPDKIRSFCKFGKWHDIEVEDDVSVYMEFPNGATGIFVTTTADAPGSNRFEITGNHGKLVCENDELTFYKLETPEREFNATYKGGFGSPKYETTVVETDGKNPQHAGILNNFANAILGLEPLMVNGAEGLASVEMMDAILLSTWKDKTVTLPIDDEEYLEELNRHIAAGRVKETVDTVLDTEGTYGSK